MLARPLSLRGLFVFTVDLYAYFIVCICKHTYSAFASFGLVEVGKGVRGCGRLVWGGVRVGLECMYREERREW